MRRFGDIFLNAPFIIIWHNFKEMQFSNINALAHTIHWTLSKVGHRAPCRGERALNKDTGSAPAAGLGVMVKKEEETNSTN